MSEPEFNDWYGRDAEDALRAFEADEAAWAQADADYDNEQEKES